VLIEAFVAFVAGSALGLLIGRRQPGGVPASPGAAASAAPSPLASELTPEARLQRLSAELALVGEASAHPRDMNENAVFREAVSVLEDTRIPLTTVIDYATGANWPLASAACAALVTRGDRSGAAVPIVSALDRLRPWPLYFALRFFESLDSPPPAGALVLHADDWWHEQTFTCGFLAEHFTCRRERGETPSFGDELPRASASHVSTAETLLKAIDHPSARELLDQLATFRRSSVDREYLQSFGRFTDDDAERALLVEHDAWHDLLAHAGAVLQQPHPRSMLVVGEPRSGKSSFLALLARRARAAGWSMFEAGGVELQAGQVYIGELEERIRRLRAEVALEKRVLWHAPDFLQLATSGTHRGQSATMLDQLLPDIAAGRIVLVSEITPAALTTLLQQRPAVRTAVELLRLRPSSDAETDRLAEAVAKRLAAFHGVEFAPDVLEIASHLVRYYAGATQMPGALIDLLKLSANRVVAHGRNRLDRAEVLSTMAQLTGMPVQLLDDRQRVDLSALRAYFTSRVIGQSEAVEAVVDRIAMLKAGLTDATKPVAVFLFAGPTGTGKTELAKSLAAYLFGSADRLIRLDMSEFQSAESLRKIVGGSDPTAPGEALTDRVRKQPFSVVLLDEFEKAHPGVWDVFLQVFDDGRLSDATGNTVDFRHCLIVLTSNIGSTIRQDSETGFVARTAAVSPAQVMKAINQSFRPEFVNRLDRIIVFRALGREQMRSIVAKELAQVLERRGLRTREWAVEWEPSALEFLLEKGFSHAMGARPLKRAIDQHLLAPLAATLVEHRFPEGDQFLFVRSDGKALQVEFVDPDAPDTQERPASAASIAEDLHAELTLPRLMLQPAGTAAARAALLAELHQLEARLEEPRWTVVESELAAGMQRADFWDSPDRVAILSRFEVMDRVRAALRSARSMSGRLDRSATPSGRYSRELIARLASQLFAIDHGIEDALAAAPVEVVLSTQPVFEQSADAAASQEWCRRLLSMYTEWAGRRGMQLSEVEGPAGRLPLLMVSGFGCARLLAGEPGLHVYDYEDNNDEGRVIARVAVAPTPSRLPDSVAERYARLTAALDAAPATTSVIRRYRDGASPLIRDLKRGWRTGRADLVFGGHFDLFGDAARVGAEDRRG
jgi:ATP-dependent Clp protease ATP-binding subunit ClpC